MLAELLKVLAYLSRQHITRNTDFDITLVRINPNGTLLAEFTSFGEWYYIETGKWVDGVEYIRLAEYDRYYQRQEFVDVDEFRRHIELTFYRTCDCPSCTFIDAYDDDDYDPRYDIDTD